MKKPKSSQAARARSRRMKKRLPPGVPNPVDIHVGSRVRLRRTLLGLSQEKLGDAVGLTFQQIQKYERGANRIGASRLFQLSRILSVPIPFFIGGKSEYSAIVDEDGAVGWMDAIPLSAGHDSGNTGDTPIDLIYVTLKSDAPIAPEVEHAPQIYPNIPLELLLENDRMIVQRVRVEPGQWTGIHSHPGNQVYIHIKGGIWSERRGGVQSPPEPFSKAGSVGWMDAVDLSMGHESGNTGDTTIDFVLVTLK